MNRNGFTLIEMLAAVVVLCAIMVIAFPMRAIQVKRTDQIRAKQQLVIIKESQDSHRMKHGTYTTDTTRLVNWKNGTRKYRFHVEYADRSRFTARAIGDMDRNSFYHDDIWVIDQSGMLEQIK